MEIADVMVIEKDIRERKAEMVDDYSSENENPDNRVEKDSEPGKMPFVLGAVANGIILISSIPFLLVPEGTRIRPMGWRMIVFSISFAALVIVLPLSISSLIRHKTNKWAIWGIVFSLLPFPLAISILGILMQVIGFDVKD
jgi:hypothetical protein